MIAARRTTARRRVGLVVSAVVVAVVLGTTLGPGIHAAGAATEPPAVHRVLIFSLPHVSWDDLDDPTLVHLRRFIDRAAIGAMSVRAGPVGTSSRSTSLVDGYVAVGAGTRALGDDLTGAEGVGVSERIGDLTGREWFAQRTGLEVPRGVVQLGIGPIVDANADLLVDGEPGALGKSLKRAGISRAVIANGDAVLTDGTVLLQRSAVSAVMDARGVVPAGQVDNGLLRSDPGAPFGVRYDNAAAVNAFGKVWRSESVVLVEASDLVRADEVAPLSSSSQASKLKADALRRSDRLFGSLLADVDFDRDAVIVVGPAHATAQVGLSVVAMRAPGVEPGLLRSATTRRAGIVQLIDVAPTVLDLTGVEIPSSMQGRPFEVAGEGGSVSERIDLLQRTDADARFIAGQVDSVARAFALLHAALIAAALLWMVGRLRGGRVGDALTFGALGLLGFVPATFLARLVDFASLGKIAYWAFVVVVSLVLAGVCRVIGRRDRFDPLLVATSVIVGVLMIDVIVGSPLELSSALGNSPIVGGRFTGFGNLAYAAIASAGLAAAALVSRRVGGRRGVAAAIVVLGVVILVDVLPFWGADVGGLLSTVPAYSVTVLLLLGWRVRLRTAVIAVVLGLLMFAAVGAIDLARPADNRTHLGRFLETLSNDGWSGFTLVIERKLAANFAVVTNTPWFWVIPIAVFFFAMLWALAPATVRRLTAPDSWTRPFVFGAAVLLVLGFFLNDSGVRVPALMLVIFDAALVFGLARGRPQVATMRWRRVPADQAELTNERSAPVREQLPARSGAPQSIE